jgi:hypothetical protein
MAVFFSLPPSSGFFTVVYIPIGYISVFEFHKMKVFWRVINSIELFGIRTTGLDSFALTGCIVVWNLGPDLEMECCGSRQTDKRTFNVVVCKHSLVSKQSLLPRILNIGTGWRWVNRFTSRSIYPQGKCPRSLLERRLGGLQTRSGRPGEEKNPWLYRESNLGRTAHSPATILTGLPGSTTCECLSVSLCLSVCLYLYNIASFVCTYFDEIWYRGSLWNASLTSSIFQKWAIWTQFCSFI